jgi:DNA-binding NtrC family response regulator
MTVLLLDDDPDQVSLRSMLLEHAGFTPVAAFDPAAALRLAAREKPVCAVVDLRVPTERAGLQFIRDLKRLQPSIPVIVLSGGDPSRLYQMPERELIAGILIKGAPARGLLDMLASFTGADCVRSAAARP